MTFNLRLIPLLPFLGAAILMLFGRKWSRDTVVAVAAVGDLLFRDFLYPFEAISILLLVAIVGGVVISRSHQKEVAANVAANYRKQVHELASHDYPGAPDEPAPEGHH